MCFKCSDPWVDEAIRQVTAGGIPMGCGNCGACNIQLYNGGLWHSYAELLRYVDEALRAMSSAKVRFKMVGGQFVVGRDGIRIMSSPIRASSCPPTVSDAAQRGLISPVAESLAAAQFSVTTVPGLLVTRAEASRNTLRQSVTTAPASRTGPASRTAPRSSATTAAASRITLRQSVTMAPA